MGAPAKPGRFCPHCGEPNPPGQFRCWLCDEPLYDAPGREVVTTPAPPQRPGGAASATPLIALALGLIVLGAGYERPGLVVPLILVGAPALLLATRRSEAPSGGEVGPDGLLVRPAVPDRSGWWVVGEVVRGLVIALAALILLFGAVVVSVVVFLFLVCSGYWK